MFGADNRGSEFHTHFTFKPYVVQFIVPCHLQLFFFSLSLHTDKLVCRLLENLSGFQNAIIRPVHQVFYKA